MVGINRVTEPWLTEVAGNLGFDVVWFDMEHRAHGYEIVDRLSLACRASGMASHASLGAPMSTR